MSVLHLERRFENLRELHDSNLAINRGDQMKEGLKHAFKTDRTIEEMARSMLELRDISQKRREVASALIIELKSENKLATNATLDSVMPCLSSQLDTQLFPDVPHISFLLQFYGKDQKYIQEVVSRLREASDNASKQLLLKPNLTVLGLSEAEKWTTIGTAKPRPFSELLVNVDSIQDHETAGAWANLSYLSGGFVVPIFSDNVHEARGYNRLASIARAPILIFLQDDEYPPRDGSWLVSLLAVYDKYPLIGAVGMSSYRSCPYSGKGPNRNMRSNDVVFRDASLGVKMQFATLVDFAPLSVRKVALDDVGGLEEGFSEPGICGIYSDWELSSRLWTGGWWVSYLPFPDGTYMERASQGGTHRPEVSGRCWERQMMGAGWAFKSRYDPLFPFICARARELTLKHLEHIEERKSECSFDQDFGGCDKSVTFAPLDPDLIARSMRSHHARRPTAG